MTNSIIPSADGSYVDVFVAMSFRRFSGRKTIVTLDGKQVLSERSKAADKTLVKALARAWRWQKLIEDGIYTNIAELADKERVNRSYLSRTMRLALLAPDIVEAILDGKQPLAMRLADLESPFPVDWEQQRAVFRFPSKINR